LHLELRLVVVLQVHGALDKEDLIMMGEGNNDMGEQIFITKKIRCTYMW
jgi:hypothetical protein